MGQELSWGNFLTVTVRKVAVRQGQIYAAVKNSTFSNTPARSGCSNTNLVDAFLEFVGYSRSCYNDRPRTDQSKSCYETKTGPVLVLTLSALFNLSIGQHLFITGISFNLGRGSLVTGCHNLIRQHMDTRFADNLHSNCL